jgi:hypothetical protein
VLRPIAVLPIPVVLFFKALHPIAILWPTPIAEELKFVVAPIEMFEQMFPPPVPISKLLIEPVTPKGSCYLS